MMTALVLLCLSGGAFSRLVITEVCPNPPGSSTSVPGDASHEYVEFLNTGPETLNLCAYYLKTGSSTSAAEPDSNDIEAWTGDSLLLPGQYALLLGRKYLSAPESSWYEIDSGAAAFLTRKTYIRSGTLANASTWIEVHERGGGLACTFNRFRSQGMDPGEKLTWHLCHPDSSDAIQNWRLAYPTPGGPFPYAGGRVYGRSIVINEIMNDPAQGSPEWIELYNFGGDTVSLAGWTLGGNENSGAFLSAHPVHIPAGGYAVVAESGKAGEGCFRDLLCPLLVPDGWDALRRDDDVVYVRDQAGLTVDSVHYLDTWFPVMKGVSVERRADGTWGKSVNGSGATPGFANSAPAPSDPVFDFKVVNRTFRDCLGIRMAAPPDGEVTLKVFDLKGRLVRTLFDGQTGVRGNLAFWDGKRNDGTRARPGPYMVYGACHLKGKRTARKVPVALAPE